MRCRLRAVSCLLLLILPGHLCAGATADAPVVAKNPDEAWARFGNAWTSSLDPMRPVGDPVWKSQYEALAVSARSFQEAAPVLDNAVSNGSPAVKRWAGLVRGLLRSNAPANAATRRALGEFDLARLDSARYGAPAPAFELTDLSGKTWRLDQFQGKKGVVLIFLGYAG